MLAYLNRQFQFSWYISGPAILLIAVMLRLSYWQWTRHLEKVELKKEFEYRLEQPPVPLMDLIKDKGPVQNFLHRRVWLEGQFDFEHEMIIRNRRHNGIPGSFVLTPLQLDSNQKAILVIRGFVPLQISTPEKRARFQKPATVPFVGLIKPSNPKLPLAPSDPPAGPDHPWVDAWLRVDIDKISKQLPYELLPFYVEQMPSADLAAVKKAIFKSKSDKAEMLNLAARSAVAMKEEELNKEDYPVIQNDLIIPPGRHFGYVFEWIFLAMLTGFIAFILQTRKVRKANRVTRKR